MKTNLSAIPEESKPSSTKIKSFQDQWDDAKLRAWPVKHAFLHTPTDVCGRTERTISDAKYPGIQMWWAPHGLMVEFKGYQETVPVTAVAKVRH